MPISQGKLCARGQAAIQITYHPDRLDKPRKRTGERGSGQFVEITWDEAIKELTGKLNELAAANDQASLAFLTKPRRGRRLELIAQLLQRFGAKPAGHLRSVLGRGAATRQREQFRLASAADVRSRKRALRHLVRRGFPGHVEFGGRAERGVWPDAQARPGRGRSSCTSTPACRRRPPTPTSSSRASRAPKACSRWPSRRSSTRPAPMRPSSRPRRLRRRPGAGGDDRAPGARVSANRSGGGDHRRRAARAHQWHCSTRTRSTRSTGPLKPLNRPGGVSFISAGCVGRRRGPSKRSSTRRQRSCWLTM